MQHGLSIREQALKLHPHSIRLAGLLICLTPVAAAVAQTVQPDAVESALQVAAASPQDEPYRVVVTGARAPMPLKDTPQRIEVVTRQEIERTPHRELADLLGKTTNVDTKRYPGMSGSVGMRGFTPSPPMTGESMQTLILQNGIPAVNNNLSFMPVNGVARIEVRAAVNVAPQAERRFGDRQRARQPRPRQRFGGLAAVVGQPRAAHRPGGQGGRFTFVRGRRRGRQTGSGAGGVGSRSAGAA